MTNMQSIFNLYIIIKIYYRFLLMISCKGSIQDKNVYLKINPDRIAYLSISKEKIL